MRKDQPVLGMLCKQTTKGNQGNVGHQINNLHVGYRYRSSRHRHGFVSFHFLTTKLSHDSYTVTTTLLLKTQLAMQRTKQNGDAVFTCEMELAQGESSSPRRSTGKLTPLDTVPEDDVSRLGNGNTCREGMSDNIDISDNENPLERGIIQDNTCGKSRDGLCNAFRDRLRRIRGNWLHSSVSPTPNEVNVYVKGEKEYAANIPLPLKVDNNEETLPNSIASPRLQKGCFFVPFISIILVVIFIMSATSLTLVIMIINGKIVATEDGAASPAKGIYL